METELFAFWGAEKSISVDCGFAVTGYRRLEADKQEIIAAGGAGVYPALSSPAGHEMKVPSEIEVPRRQENEYQVYQRAAAQQREGRLNQATKTTAAPALRQFVVKCVTTSHGIGPVVPTSSVPAGIQ
jgi:hypothetical protein